MCGGGGGRCPGVQADAQEAGADTLQPGLQDTGTGGGMSNLTVNATETINKWSTHFQFH